MSTGVPTAVFNVISDLDMAIIIIIIYVITIFIVFIIFFVNIIFLVIIFVIISVSIIINIIYIVASKRKGAGAWKRKVKEPLKQKLGGTLNPMIIFIRSI